MLGSTISTLIGFLLNVLPAKFDPPEKHGESECKRHLAQEFI